MDIEQRQLVKKRLLLDVKEILDDMGVMFWLHSGVLLGYYRERDLIKHDPDLDLGVLRSQIPENFAERLARRLEGSDMRLTWKTETCLKIDRDHVHCDIFIHEKNGDTLNLGLYDGSGKRKIEYTHCLVSGKNKVRFLGAEFVVPDNPLWEIYRSYGPGWMEPVKEYKWDIDPCGIVGKPILVPDETPKTDVLVKRNYGKHALVLGPLSEKDAKLLDKVCENGQILASQHYEDKWFPTCDETHCRYMVDPGAYDFVIVPHPELYNEHNLYELIGTAQYALADKGRLLIVGKVPSFMSEFMFELKEDGTFEKYDLHENWEKNVTAVITTYESPSIVADCVASVKKYYPDMRIVVVDNSKTPTKIDGVKFVELPEDAGLSASRNAGLLYVNTPYVFITDDDQYVTDSSSVKRMYESAINNKLDLVGGSVVHSVSKIPAIYTGTMTRKPDRVELIRGKYRTLADGTDIVDVTMNFFVAKMEIFKKIQWNRNLKICEHMDFFMKAQDLGLKIGNIPDATCLHMKNRGLRTKEYQIQRRRYDYFTNRCMRMNGLKEYTSFDGGRVVYPVSTQKGDGMQTGNAERRSPGTYRSCREAARVWSSRH